MDVRITWALPPDIAITDEFDVFYKEADPANINNWIKANPTPLASTVNFYDITGLNPGTIYRFGVTKSCLGTGSLLDQISYYAIACPIISIYQGAPPAVGSRSTPTLFYSVYYPDSTHVSQSSINILDYTEGNAFLYTCGTPGLIMAAPVGRTFYEPIDICDSPLNPTRFNNNNTDKLDLYPLNSSLTSAVGYYGLGTNTVSPNPVLLQAGTEYRLYVQATVLDPSINSLPPGLQLTSVSNIIGSCTDTTGNLLPRFNTTVAPSNANLISGALCYDSATGKVNLSLKDGTNQVYLPSISGYTYTTEDSLGNTLPLVNSSSVIINTGNVTYTVYCPVEIDPVLVSSQLSAGMTVTVNLYDPAPNNICTIANANYTGLTLLQACQDIATYITNNTPYTADAVTIGGSVYIRVGVTGVNVVSAEVIITGPAVLGPNLPDILQVNPSGFTDNGIQDAFIYDSGSGDKIYGTRGFFTNDTGIIEVTDINTATSLQYNHTIDVTASRISLVDVPPPATAWDINISDSGAVGVGGINQDIVKTPAVWNTGYCYRLFYTDGSGTEIRVTDSTGTFVDSEFLTVIAGNSECARLVSVNQTVGTDLVIIVDDPANPGQSTVEVVSHTGVGTWSSVITYTCPSSNEIIKGTVTGESSPYSVVSSTQYSITVAGAPWATNQYNRWTVEIISGAYAGTKVRLYHYCLLPTCDPPQTNISNDTNTIYIDPAGSFGFDASLLSPGDQFVFLNSYANWGNVYDINASYPPDIFPNYNITFEDGSNPTLGNEFFTARNTPTRIGFTSKAIGSYFSRVEDIVTTTTNLTYGTPYRIYKINDGDIVWNPTVSCWYHSCGNGQINVLDNTGVIATVQLLEPDGITPADGSFQIAITASTGDAYCIQRDSNDTGPGNTTVPIRSSNIYRLNTIFNSLAAIDGSTLWNEDVAGNISYYDDGSDEYLFFTSIESRSIYKYDIGANTFTSKTVPSVYKKSATDEKIQGAVHIADDRLVIMNKLNATSGTDSISDYLFSNLFVYDFSTNLIEQVLVGAQSTPYSGPSASWNTASYGEMFGELCGNKDYGKGGLSIKVDGNRIFWKQWATDNHYQSESFSETGVAQIWGTCRLDSITNGSLIKIWNIQSDGSLQSSNRSLYCYKSERSIQNLPVKLEYDTFYNHVIGVTFQSYGLVLIDPVDFTGYYGGPYWADYNNYADKLAISTIVGPNPIVFPSDFITNNQGEITLIGRGNGLNTTYRRYTSADITNPNNTYTSSGVLADTSTGNPGLFYVGFQPGYAQVYDPINNQIWVMGRQYPDACNNPPCPPNSLTPANIVIGVLDHDTMAVVDTINLTAQNAGIVGSIGYYHLGFYAPGMNAVCYRSGAADKLLMLDANTKQIIYNGTTTLAANFLRVPAFVGGDYGWMVPYNNGVYLDYNNNTATQERWIYITPQSVAYSANTHNLLNATFTTSNIIVQDDVYASSVTADTFGQWKVTTALPLPGDDVVYWDNIPGGGSISINANETLELVQFSMENPIVSVENLTQSNLYEITDVNYVNQNTLPTFNTLNSVPFFAIKADNVNLFNGDVLQLTFENPVYPSCPFITTVTINF